MMAVCVLAACRGKCVRLNGDSSPNTLSYKFSECTKGASSRSVLCEREGSTATFACTCSEDGKETGSFKTAAPGIQSDTAASYEALNEGCKWSDIEPFGGSK